jgi:HEAT repeat protein
MSLYELERTGDVQELIRVIRESDNERVRARGAELLRNFPDHDDRQDVVSALVRAAQDENDDVAAKAVDSLDELGGDAIEQLIGNVAGVDLDRDALAELRIVALGQVDGAHAAGAQLGNDFVRADTTAWRKGHR